ncbi:carboxypeptidase regulatory-like domain-containing protein, partial [Silvibacterium sp.]|uniref:carboxypeptidase regulatory-like domain-containing protein n=1 Tax=Silvibacterium sp. TaxID=1964179 RepID=UPI0039E3ECC8
MILASLSAIAQQASHAVGGVVVSAATGQPLAGCELALTAANPEAGQTATVVDVVTDATGRFLFAHVPAGRYNLAASHAGYLQSGYLAHEELQAAVVIGTETAVTDMRVELKPLATLYGTVTDDSGDTVTMGSVSLYRQESESGRDKILRVGSQQVDDFGHYEFPRLPEGVYYLVATAHPWYATDTHRSYLTPLPGNTTVALVADPPQDTPQSPLDVAYATAYYPDTTDASAATPIPLKAGDHTEVNFSMHAVPAVHVRLTMPKDASGRGPQIGRLHENVFGQDFPLEGITADYHDSGENVTIDLASMAPGQYTFDMHEPGTGEDRSAAINATSGNASIAAGAAGTLAAITGKIGMAHGEPLPQPLSVTLLPLQDGLSSASSSVQSDGSFHIASVQEGAYEVSASSGAKLFTTVQMMAQGATAGEHQLKVGTAP